jgi:hypothetical protein
MRLRAGTSDVQSLLSFVFVALLVMGGIGVWFTIRDDGATKQKQTFQAVEPTDEPTEKTCPSCNGKVTVPCPTCVTGKGIYLLDSDGKCPTCQGAKVWSCTVCKGSGKVTLPPQPGVLKWGK